MMAEKECPVCGFTLSHESRLRLNGNLDLIEVCHECGWSGDLDPDVHTKNRVKPRIEFYSDRERSEWEGRNVGGYDYDYDG